VCAELAHAEDGQAGTIGLAVQAQHTLAVELQQQGIDCDAGRGAGEAAQRLGNPREVPAAGDVGNRNGKGEATLGPAQCGTDAVRGGRGGDFLPQAFEAGEQRIDHQVGALMPHFDEKRGLGERGFREIWRIAE
jgi:hypothetical protein